MRAPDEQRERVPYMELFPLPPTQPCGAHLEGRIRSAAATRETAGELPLGAHQLLTGRA